MKKYILLFGFIVISFAYCKKSSPVLGYPVGYQGTVEGVLFNGKSWMPEGGAKTIVFGYIRKSDSLCNYTTSGIVIASYTADPFVRENLHINGLNLKKGKYFFSGDNAVKQCDPVPNTFLTLGAEDGDALAGAYLRSKSAESSVTIASYDTITGDVSGTFDITFVKDYLTAGYYTNYTDTVRFSGGIFKTKWLK